MPFIMSIDAARELFPSYEFVRALTPSAQKAAFHVRKDGRDLCLKIIAPTQALDRVQREVLAMQTIQHPNVVKLLEYEYSARAGNSRHYLIEEFIEGKDMSAVLVPGKPWPLGRLIAFFGAICDGLEELNSHNIVHRDLKPSNIRVRSDGVPVIIDFGLARLLDMESLTETLAGAMIGTPRYFSPEQFRGTKRDIDHRTDLYALGVLIYEAAVGHHPSMTDKPQTLEQLSDAVCNSESFVNNVAFKELPPKLNLLVRRLLEKERARRPAGAKLVGQILRNLGGGQ